MTQTTSGAQNQKTVVERIPVDYLMGEREVPFPLYRKEAEKKFNLFKKPGQLVESAELKGLNEEGVSTLYINTLHRPLLDGYLCGNARAFVAQPDTPIAVKSRYLYDSSTQVLKRFFENPEHMEPLQQVSDLAEVILEMVLANSTAFHSLIEVSSHDYYTFSHSVDVMIYAVGLGGRLGFEPERLRRLAVGAILHDVGKSRIDTAIINKRGKLDEAEYKQMKEHPELGAQVLMLLDEPDREIYATVVHHHERYDGNGYPSKLKGEEIPLFAQIVGISDVFAALSTKRSYKDAFRTFEALRIMKEEMSGHFSPKLLKEFVQLMGSAGSGAAPRA